MYFEYIEHPQPRVAFKAFLLEYYLIHSFTLKTFAIVNCGVTMRVSNPLIIILAIINYFYDYYDLSVLDINTNDNQETSETPFSSLEEEEISGLNFLIEYMFQNQQQISGVTNFNNIKIETQVIQDKKTETTQESDNEDNKDNNEDVECGICYYTFNRIQFIKLNCNHEFCKDCTKNLLKIYSNRPCCALCRGKIERITYKSPAVQKEFSDVISETTNNLIV
jgi:hypothetical protein